MESDAIPVLHENQKQAVNGVDKQSRYKCPPIPSSAEDTQHNIKDYANQGYQAYQYGCRGPLPLGKYNGNRGDAESDDKSSTCT